MQSFLVSWHKSRSQPGGWAMVWASLMASKANVLEWGRIVSIISTVASLRYEKLHDLPLSDDSIPFM